MVKKVISIVLAMALAVPGFAQNPTGGVKGTVVNRIDKSPVGNVTILLSRDQEKVAETLTSKDGSFYIPDLADGVYEMVLKDSDFLETNVFVTVNGGFVKNMFTLSMTPASVADDSPSDLTPVDLEDSGHQDNPVNLSSSNDVFANVTGYNFSAVRFSPRGYAGETQDVYYAGVKLNDALSGYSPYSLWSGLNEAVRSKDVTDGSDVSQYGLGTFNGVTNISGMASDMRTGWRGSVLTNSAFYRLRLALSYGSGRLDNGWAYAFNVSTRLGGNDWVKGVYYRSFGYYASVDKVFGLDSQHKLGLSILAAPGERGAQNGSTQEVYDLTGDNMYNSNWGYQNGKVRNSRVRRTHEPVVALKYDFTPAGGSFKASASVVYRFGHNGYTALDWYDSYDPRPDYYRNLPSYYFDENPDLERFDKQMAAWAAEAWRNDYAPVAHVNWDYIYNVNFNAEGGRSKIVQEQRHIDQKDLNAAANFRWNIPQVGTLTGGVDFKWNRTENYKKIADLLGGEYFLNINQYAERDYAASQAMIQNDLDYWLSHNRTPQSIYTGGKYGYDYYAHVRNGNAWMNINVAGEGFEYNQGVSVGYKSYWREGLVRNGLFAGAADDGSDIVVDGVNLTELSAGQTSKGNSKKLDFFTYALKTSLAYVFQGGHKLSGHLGFFNDAPQFNQSFVSPRTRNTVMEGISTIKTFSSDLNYNYSSNGCNVRLTGYFSYMWDKSDLMSIYDDVQNSFTNFALTGISEIHTGIELGFKVPTPFRNLYLQGAVSLGKFIYASNPYMTQTVDNSSETIINHEILPYWQSHPIFARDANGEFMKDDSGDYVVDHYQEHYVPGSPQLATTLGLNYNVKGWFLDMDAEYFRGSYIDMNPLYRTDLATSGADKTPTPAEVEYMCSQEMFRPAFLMNFSVGKAWYFGQKSIGFSLSARNILNNTDVVTGGYEQTRLVDNTKSKMRYYRFPSRYFYMCGANYMFNVYFRF